MHHSKLCAYNNIDINYPHEKILIGNEMIQWWGCVLPGSQILSFQNFCLSIWTWISGKFNLTLLKNWMRFASLREKKRCFSVSSVAQSCLTLCSPMDCSMPGFPVLHYLLEFARTHVYWISDAIQTSHPLSSPILSALSLVQTQGLFQWVCSSNQVAKVLELRLQYQFSSVEFSRSVVSDSLWSHGLKHARLPSITNSQSLLKLMSIE